MRLWQIFEQWAVPSVAANYTGMACFSVLYSCSYKLHFIAHSITGIVCTLKKQVILLSGMLDGCDAQPRNTQYITALSGAGCVNHWQSIQSTEMSAWLRITWQEESATRCWLILSCTVSQFWRQSQHQGEVNSQRINRMAFTCLYYRHCKIFMLLITPF